MSDGNGLDKRGRLAKKRSDAEEEAKIEREKFSPEFPYRMEMFPYNFFGVDRLIDEPVDANTD